MPERNINNLYTGLERIDLTGTGDNALTLDVRDVLALSDTSNELLVDGNAGDTVNSLGEGWVNGGGVNVGGINYNQYTFGAASLLVDTDVIQNIT